MLARAESGDVSNSKEGVAVRVVVRCRPKLDQSEPAFVLTSESMGRDKIVLGISAPDEEWDKLNGGEETRRLRAQGVRSFRCNCYLGPDANQEAVYTQAIPIVQQIMEGSNGTIFSYGISSSGKTFTMCGTGDENTGKHRENPNAGVTQRVGRQIFEYIRDRSSRGEVFIVEASYLEIYSPDGTKEQLIDLLAPEERKVEVRQDPLNSNSFLCEGLRKVPIRTPDDISEVLSIGQQRCAYMEANKGIPASRSHCLLMLSVESLQEHTGAGEPLVRRGKLMLVDLAGSESMKRVQANGAVDEETRRKQALGINRVLGSLTSVVNSLSIPNTPGTSAVTLLLRDCLGGSARALLIANVGPELVNIEETSRTLTFAQSLLSVRNVVNVNRIDQDHSSLLQMKQRHNECIRILQEKVTDSREEEQEERKKLQQEMEDLNQRLLTKESAEKTLTEIQEEQVRKIDEMRQAMAQAMNEQLERMRMQSQQDLDSLRASVEESAQFRVQNQRAVEEHEARVSQLQGELKAAEQAQRAALEEASELRVKLAQAEERAKMLKDRQEELRKERADFDEERKLLRQQSDQQWQKLSQTESELQRYKADAEVQRSEIARISAARAEEAEKVKADREAWRAREVELQQTLSDVARKLEELKRDAEVKELKAAQEHGKVVQELEANVDRLEQEVEQVKAALESKTIVEGELLASRQRQEAIRQQSAAERDRMQAEVADALTRETELMKMLEEVQQSIIYNQQVPGLTLLSNSQVDSQEPSERGASQSG